MIFLLFLLFVLFTDHLRYDTTRSLRAVSKTAMWFQGWSTSAIWPRRTVRTLPNRNCTSSSLFMLPFSQPLFACCTFLITLCLPRVILNCYTLHILSHVAGTDLTIWGTGSPLRQFIYSEDLARLTVRYHSAVLYALEKTTIIWLFVPWLFCYGEVCFTGLSCDSRLHYTFSSDHSIYSIFFTFTHVGALYCAVTHCH